MSENKRALIYYVKSNILADQIRPAEILPNTSSPSSEIEA